MTALAKLVRAAVHAEKKARDRPVEDDPQTDSSLESILPDLPACSSIFDIAQVLRGVPVVTLARWTPHEG
jgi:hypothetical protein